MSFNDQIIAEFRANGGHVETAGFGDNLVLLHTVGAKSGEARVSPLMAIAHDGGWDVIASAAGAAAHPAWYFNIAAEPQVSVETGTAVVPVLATELEGSEREAAWEAFTARSTAFEGYQQRAGERLLPIVRLSPR